MIKKIVLVAMPFINPTSPPLGIASLKSYLERNSDVGVKCIDVNLLFYLDFLEYLKTEGKELNDREEIMVGFKDFIKEKGNFRDLDRLNYNISEFLEGFEDVKEKAQVVSKEFIKGKREDLSLLDKYARLILDEKPDIVGFSICYRENFRISLAMAKRIRGLSPNVKILFGGSYVSLIRDNLSKIVGKLVDYIAYNQGEDALLGLVNHTDLWKIPNLIYRKGEEIITNKEEILLDLNNLPFVDFSDFNLDNYFTPFPVLPVVFSKGCYWKKCAFCVHHHSYSNTYRFKDVDRFVDELEHYNNEYGVRHFYFVDEMISSVQFGRIADAIIQRRLDVFYYALVKPTNDFSFDILKKMYDSGCRCLLLGVESGNQRILDLMNKGTNAGEIASFLRISSKAGIKNCCFIVIGFPTETLSELEDTKKFILDNKEFIELVFYGKFGLEKNSYVFLNPDRFGIRIKDSGGIGNDYSYENVNGEEIGDSVYDDAKKFFSKINGDKQCFAYLRDIMLIYYSD